MSDYQIVFPLAVGWPRLANQMFQYAVSQLLALRTDSKVVLDKNRLNSGMFSFHKYFKNLDFVTEYNQSILQNNCKYHYQYLAHCINNILSFYLSND